MLDIATIQNTLRKRLEPIAGKGFADFSNIIGQPDISVMVFKDAVGVAICVLVNNVAYPITFKLPRDPRRSDVLNACDFFAEAIVSIQRAPRMTAAEWDIRRRYLAKHAIDPAADTAMDVVR